METKPNTDGHYYNEDSAYGPEKLRNSLQNECESSFRFYLKMTS